MNVTCEFCLFLRRHHIKINISVVLVIDYGYLLITYKTAVVGSEQGVYRGFQRVLSSKMSFILCSDHFLHCVLA